VDEVVEDRERKKGHFIRFSLSLSLSFFASQKLGPSLSLPLLALFTNLWFSYEIEHKIWVNPNFSLFFFSRAREIQNFLSLSLSYLFAWPQSQL